MQRETAVYTATVDLVTAPLYSALKRGARLRSEQWRDAALQWKLKTPSTVRLTPLRVERSASKLYIAELRLGSADLVFRHWEEPLKESSVSIDLVVATLTHRRLRIENEVLAIVSLHALARRYERHRERDDAAMYSDLAAITPHCAGLAKQLGKRFRVDLPHGAWVGEVPSATFVGGTSGDLPVPAVRSWIPPSAISVSAATRTLENA